MPSVLSEAQVAASIAEQGLEWRMDEAGELVKVARRQDFAAALELVNAVGALAEEANHHPDIDIRWNVVTLRLSTHSAGGITAADLNLAAAIDRLGGSDG